MFPAFDKEEILVQEHHRRHPVSTLTLLFFPHLTLESFSSSVVPFEIAFCQSQVQRKGGQVEVTNLDLPLDTELGNTIGRMVLIYFWLSSVSSTCVSFPSPWVDGWMDVGRRRQPLCLESEGLNLIMALFPVPIISESLSFHTCKLESIISA